MPNPNSNVKIDMSLIETPFTIRKVETHLIFGPIAKRVPFKYLVLCGGILYFIIGLCATHKPVGRYIVGCLDKLLPLLILPLLFRITKRQQAIIGWMGVKSGLGLGAVILATAAGISFQRHYADAWANLFLGLIWIPGIEFIPRITPHQRYVTLARLALSIPCIYCGVSSGNWRW